MRFPGDTDRHAIYGMTGSGKTQFGLWCLSQRNYDRKPWIILDFKRDKIIRKIPRLEEIGLNSSIPKHAGLYVVRPLPRDIDNGGVTDWFYSVWKRENTGVFIDEGAMLPQHDEGFRALLTQGRSKHIPVIMLSQRPAYISAYVHSESEFRTVFFLQHQPDLKRVKEYLPPGAPSPYDLPEHHSIWFAARDKNCMIMAPCPKESSILDTFDSKVVRKRWFPWFW